MRSVLALLAVIGPLFADGIPKDEYRARRIELAKSLEGVMVLFGANESDDLHTGFFQETNFLYLTGWREPGAILLLTPKEEMLFLPPRNLISERFTGRKLGAEDENATAVTGLAKVLPTFALQANLQRVLESSRRIYLAPDDSRAAKLKPLALFHEEESAITPIARLRMIKSPAEIQLLTSAADASVAAHLAAWSKIKAGLYEYQVAAAMTDVYFERGCERSAYAPIVGSGANSTILHYSSNHRRLDSGELVLMDVGAECSDYASDVTRTVPVSGKFTSRQREIYEVVLGAQKAAIAAVRPGAKLHGGGSLQEIAYQYIDSHGHDLHGESLGRYFTHGLSHHVGLDVHDSSDMNAPLEAGMVITIEPGIYIPEENIGIRIEDTILVTADGAKNLSGSLPREPKEIERLVDRKSVV